MQLQRDIAETEKESLRGALARVCAPVHIVLALSLPTWPGPLPGLLVVTIV